MNWINWMNWFNDQYDNEKFRRNIRSMLTAMYILATFSRVVISLFSACGDLLKAHECTCCAIIFSIATANFSCTRILSTRRKYAFVRKIVTEIKYWQTCQTRQNACRQQIWNFNSTESTNPTPKYFPVGDYGNQLPQNLIRELTILL